MDKKALQYFPKTERQARNVYKPIIAEFRGHAPVCTPPLNTFLELLSELLDC